ncbi:WAP four-disulfide core domain protein 2 [Crocuta crocuta]
MEKLARDLAVVVDRRMSWRRELAAETQEVSKSYSEGGREAEKAGVCPQLQADLNCTQECHSDAQCASNLKCCQAGCATICHLPNEKQGSCPQVNTDFPQLGLCQNQCEVDSQCPGLLKCCYNGCGKVSCVTPVL